MALFCTNNLLQTVIIQSLTPHSVPPPLRVPQVVDDRDGDDGVGGAGLEGEREAVRAHRQQAAIRADPHEILAEVAADLKYYGIE